jgi:hypothetical protein
MEKLVSTLKMLKIMLRNIRKIFYRIRWHVTFFGTTIGGYTVSIKVAHGG